MGWGDRGLGAHNPHETCMGSDAARPRPAMPVRGRAEPRRGDARWSAVPLSCRVDTRRWRSPNAVWLGLVRWWSWWQWSGDGAVCGQDVAVVVDEFGEDNDIAGQPEEGAAFAVCAGETVEREYVAVAVAQLPALSISGQPTVPHHEVISS